jgi:MarR family 2-MHQ and catechol resistance regulon transcriptional repressor
MRTKSGPESPRYRALLELLRTADVVWNASRIFFGQWDLSPSQFNVLNLLHLTPLGLSQTELSRELIMHRSNVTGLVDRLEKRGLVERRDAAKDRRAYRVVLTPAGARVLRDILPGYYAGADRLWEGFSGQRAMEMVMELQKVAENAGRIVADIPRHNPEAKAAYENAD